VAGLQTKARLGPRAVFTAAICFVSAKKITTFAMKAILPCRPPASEDAA